MQSTFHMEKKMGKNLGGSNLLQRQVQDEQREINEASSNLI